jgi:uncharacterized DUF497 family protein
MKQSVKKTSPSSGVDFSAIESFVWGEAVVAEDTRHDYGEIRYTAFGPINGRLHFVFYHSR